MLLPIAFHAAISSSIVIPRSVVRADGKVTAEEYEGSWKAVNPCGTVYACFDNDRLYIGFSPKESGIASVFLLNGNTLTVLHASAALGTATYRISNQSAKCVKKFDWQARPTPASDYSKKLDAFWRLEKWSANSIDDPKAQNNDREFQVSLDLIQSQSTKIFLIYDSTMNSSVTFTFPQFRQISSQWVELSRGNEVDLNLLDFSDWPVIELKQTF
ncbi:MAG: hypothetical protein KF824_05225 [Fimbriimonadaceae bacterium]|nr:MAG: hypothetical protein KF824_05225 [Fimbriimonadaceae bacterium]